MTTKTPTSTVRLVHLILWNQVMCQTTFERTHKFSKLSGVIFAPFSIPINSQPFLSFSEKRYRICGARIAWHTDPVTLSGSPLLWYLYSGRRWTQTTLCCFLFCQQIRAKSSFIKQNKTTTTKQIFTFIKMNSKMIHYRSKVFFILES